VQRYVVLESRDDLAAAVAALDVASPRPSVVVVGGAAGLGDAAGEVAEPVAAAVVRAAATCEAVLVDGGTDAGIMRLVGRALAAAGAPVPLVGVVVRELAALPGQPVVEPMAALEPAHTHFVLVPGSSWGEEAPWIARIAGAVAVGRRSVTVLVNGGEIAWTDVAESVEAGRPVLVVAGTGRTADELAEAAAGRPRDDRAAALVATGLVEAVGPGPSAAGTLERRIEQVLMATGAADAR
jgi:hypothetical protein